MLNALGIDRNRPDEEDRTARLRAVADAIFDAVCGRFKLRPAELAVKSPQDVVALVKTAKPDLREIDPLVLITALNDYCNRKSHR